MTGESAGSAADFAAFVRANTRSLFGTAILLTGRRHHAEDLLQETLTALYPRWETVQRAGKPLAYVRRAVVNRFLNSTRTAVGPGPPAA